MDNEIHRPALGSPESALLGFVNAVSCAAGIAEEKLAYWLDAYYQLRRTYERDAEIETAWDDTILCKSDLEPIMRQLWQETLKKSCREEAGKRLAARAAEPAAPEAEEPEPATNANKAAAILPELDEKRLPEAVLGLMVQVNAFQADGLRELARIAADGHVDQEELQDYNVALAQLQTLIGAALGLLYAKGET